MTQLKAHVPVSENKRRLTLFPSIPDGEFAQDRARVYNAEVKEKFNRNPNLIPSDDFSGINLFKALLVDEIVNREYEGKLRVALPKDLDKRVVELVKNKFYTVPRALAFRNTNEIWEKNKTIEQVLSPFIEQAYGRLPQHAIISGLKVQPLAEDEKGYGLKLVPVEGEFQVNEDGRLSLEYDGWTFDTIDELGLPSRDNLRKEGGSRIWYTSDERVSGFCLDGIARLVSDVKDLASSSRHGWVILVAGVVGARKI